MLQNLRRRLREWIAARRTPEPVLTRRFIGRPRYSVSHSSDPQKARETWDLAMGAWFARKDDPTL